MWYPYLPKRYIEFIKEKYSPIEGRIEDRVYYFYTRGKEIKEKEYKKIRGEKKPIVIEEIKQAILYEPIDRKIYTDIVLVHKNWKENMERFLDPIETISIPYLVNPIKFPYTYPFVYLNEFVTHIDMDNFIRFLGKENIEANLNVIVDLLEQKGTFIVLTGRFNNPISEVVRAFAIRNGILYGEWEVERKII
jgi:hypothetical protein